MICKNPGKGVFTPHQFQRHCFSHARVRTYTFMHLHLVYVANNNFQNYPSTPKGQVISKGLFVILNYPKKGTKKFDYSSSGRLVFACILVEIEDTKKTFRS